MLLNVTNLTKTYKDFTAVNRISFAIEEKQCVALLGPNGSGKTTTLNMLSGLLEKTDGVIQFMGKEVLDRHEIGYLPQYPTFFSWMTPIEYLQFAGRLSSMTQHERATRCEEMLQFVGLEDARKKRIGGFSGGMKQRLGLAQALLHDPKLLILDEPVSALDPAGRRDVLNMMEELKERMAILFSTHILHDAEQVCDETIMLQRGQIKWQGSLQALREENDENVFMVATKEPLIEWLKEKSTQLQVKRISDYRAEVIFHQGDGRNQLLQELLASHFTVDEFLIKRKSLEEIYLEVVSE